MRDCRGKKTLFCSLCGRLGVQSVKCCRQTTHKVGSLVRNSDNQKDIRPFIKITVLQKEYNALIDTGSTRSYVNKNIYEEFIKRNLKPKKIEETAILANGAQIVIKEALPIQISIGTNEFVHQMLHHPEITNVILGMDILRKIGMSVQWTPNQNEKRQKKRPERTVINTYTESKQPELYDRDPTLPAQEISNLQKLITEKYKKCDISPKGNTWVKHKTKLIHRQAIKQKYYLPSYVAMVANPENEMTDNGTTSTETRKKTRRGKRGQNRPAKKKK